MLATGIKTDSIGIERLATAIKFVSSVLKISNKYSDSIRFGSQSTFTMIKASSLSHKSIIALHRALESARTITIKLF